MTATTKKATEAKRGDKDVLAALAAAAQGKARPASRISAANIERVRAALKGEAPSERVGIGINLLAQLASGAKPKAALRDEQFLALRDFGAELGSRTFYGKKFAAMLWAIERANGKGHSDEVR